MTVWVYYTYKLRKQTYIKVLSYMWHSFFYLRDTYRLRSLVKILYKNELSFIHTINTL